MTDTSSPDAASAAPVAVDARLLQPWLTALVRWAMQALGVWLVAHGLSQASSDRLEPILTGLVLSLSALGWSLLQKRLAQLRLVRAAGLNPAKVVIRR